MIKGKSSDAKLQHMCTLIVGPTKSGKTTLAATLPVKDTLYIGFEKDLTSLQHVDMECWLIDGIEDLSNMMLELTAGVPYKNIFIDSLTRMGTAIFRHIKPNYTKSQTFGLYEDYSTQLMMFIEKIAAWHKYNFYVTCLDRKDEDGEITLDIVQKSLSKRIPSYFNAVLYLKVFDTEEGKKRALGTDNSVADFCGVRGNINGIIETFEKPDLTALTNKILKLGEING